MKVFCDFHHGGLARSLFYLFADRLGHELRFPDPVFAAAHGPGGVWNSVHPEWIYNMGGMDPAVWQSRSGTVSHAEFMDTAWDAIIVSRTESQPVYDALAHPREPVRIGISGNEHIAYDWSRVRLLIATDEASTHMAPDNLPWILTVQELGRHYGARFVPVTEAALRRVHSYINNMPGMAGPFDHIPIRYKNQCPHCGSRDVQKRRVDYLTLWQATRSLLPEYTFHPYGHFNLSLGGESLYEKDLPAAYTAAAVTWHFKSAEGYGHSVLQSIACGRPAIVPRGFFRYRMGGRFLIPGITCFECDYSADHMAAAIRAATASIDTANRNALRCYRAAQALMDWQHEAWRVQQWLNRVL